MSATTPAVGAVYDRGYRPYTGPRGGRSAAVAALWRASVRRALGIRRPWRQKVLPWLLLAIVTVPALVNIGIAYVTRDTPLRDFSIITYREYIGISSSLLLFVALTAPDIICPDRRQWVLPLIFSRPLTGTDYVIAKLAAIGALVFGFSMIPQVVLFIGQMLVSPDGALGYFRDNAGVLWQVPAAAMALTVYYAALGLAISSLTSRRLVAGASLLGTLLVSSSVAAILRSSDTVHAGWQVVNLAALPIHVRDLIFLGQLDPEVTRLADADVGGAFALVAYLLVVGASLGVLLWRYRWADV